MGHGWTLPMPSAHGWSRLINPPHFSELKFPSSEMSRNGNFGFHWPLGTKTLFWFSDSDNIMNKVNRLLLFGAVVSFIGRGLVSAQTPPTLGLNLFAGVNITGATGSVYAVQSTADLAQSNSWTTVAFVQLNRTNMLFVD